MQFNLIVIYLSLQNFCVLYFTVAYFCASTYFLSSGSQFEWDFFDFTRNSSRCWNVTWFLFGHSFDKFGWRFEVTCKVRFRYTVAWRTWWAGHHKGGQWVLIIRAYGVTAGGIGGNNISAAATAEYRCVCYRVGFSVTIFENRQNSFDIKVSRKRDILNNSTITERTTLDGFDGRNDKCTRVFPRAFQLARIYPKSRSRPYLGNIFNVTGTLVVETEAFCVLPLQSFIQTAGIPRFIFGKGGVYSLSLSFSLLSLPSYSSFLSFSFSNTSISGFFPSLHIQN